MQNTDQILQAMDIPQWHLRDISAERQAKKNDLAQEVNQQSVIDQKAPDSPAVASKAKSKAVMAALQASQNNKQDTNQANHGSAQAEKAAVTSALSANVAELSWPELKACIADCQRCELHQTRTQTVFGVGNQQADLMIIGEAPGADEDLQGEPFVGRAGQLLDKMLFAIGLQRQQVFIANILKCRPPNNRNPSAAEAQMCASYLHRQIELVKPKLILSVGKVSASNLLGLDGALGKMRGEMHQHAATGTPVLVTYHPAYLLRSPLEKRKAWEDLQRVQMLLKS